MAGLVGWGVFLVGVVGLFAGPFWLYKRWRRPAAFDLAWTESDATAGYRQAEREMLGRLELSGRLEASTKLGFFLGLLGFLWTPIVLWAALLEGVRPMILIGLPGLLVSWSIFFSSRAVLRQGPAATSWLRATAVGEALLNVWVLAVVVLTTIAKDAAYGSALRESISSFLLVKDSSFDDYAIPYALQQGGVLAVGYALVSFTHAALSLAACAPLGRARGQQAPAVEVAA